MTNEENIADDDCLDLAEEQEQEEFQKFFKLDYSIESPEERNELVKKIIENTPPENLSNKYLEKLADYVVFAMDKQERKKRKILTDNRMVTVNKRETSFQGLVNKFENGEDGIYNMIVNDKNIIFTPKVSITDKDLEDIPELRQLKDAITAVEESSKTATGKRKYLLKQQVIEMRQDQYVIKNAYRRPIYCMNVLKGFSKINLNEKIKIDAEGRPQSNCLVSFFNPEHISALLCNYSKLKEDCWSKFYSDFYYMMEDLDNLIENALKEKYPYYYDLLIYKIDGKQNLEIQDLLYQKHHIRHSIEYISSLWRKKIPKIIAEYAEDEFLIWYYTVKEKGQWKRCSRCGEIKLAHNNFFSRNKTSKDGWYSICKCCRNKKRGV